MMEFLKKIIVYIVTLEARLVLKKYKPSIVAITGSVGKTSTKDATAAVLAKKFSVRKTKKSYNSEVGVPLVVLGCENAWYNPFLWFLNILQGLKLLIFKNDYPEWLVLELGVERPGDMANLVSWISPKIAVMTALSEVPSHVEYFSGPEAVVKEKTKILKNLNEECFFVLNGGDEDVFALKDKTKARSIVYGFNRGADLLASNYHLMSKDIDGRTIPEGITFKVDYHGSSVPVRVFNAFGYHHVFPVLAALGVGTVLGLNLVEMSDAIASYVPPPGRLRLVEGEKNSYILDDTYNSSPVAAYAALETLRDLPSKRKIAVWGDMLELGKYTIEVHKELGNRTFGVADLVFAVGPRAKFIAASLREKGFNEKNIFEFSTSDEAKKSVEEIIKEGDLILVKGSQAMRMEKIVEEIMAHPEQKEALLVRQEKAWKTKKAKD